MKHFCKDCGKMVTMNLPNGTTRSACPHFQSPVDPEKDGCNRFSFKTNEIPNCRICGNPIVRPEEAGFLESEYYVCGDCLEKGFNCMLCKTTGVCALEQDKSGRPKVVQQQSVQGNIIVTSQVLNPELVKEHCLPCRCYHGGICFQHAAVCCDNFELSLP